MVFSDQMSELATHAFDFRLYFRFGIRVGARGSAGMPGSPRQCRR